MYQGKLFVWATPFDNAESKTDVHIFTDFFQETFAAENDRRFAMKAKNDQQQNVHI